MFFVYEFHDRGKVKMRKLIELENVLADIECLADTFCALDIASQSGSLEFPCCALSVPSESLKLNAKRARELYESILQERKKSVHL